MSSQNNQKARFQSNNSAPNGAAVVVPKGGSGALIELTVKLTVFLHSFLPSFLRCE
jgi:hypothetical protein